MVYDVVIIGSGLGGLACGITLAKEGRSVLVLEQGAVAGGCLQSFRRGDCLLDTGMHYAGSLRDGQILNQYFKYWDIYGKVSLVDMDADGFDEILFDDGRRYAHAIGLDRFADAMATHFPAEASAIDGYCSLLNAVGSLVGPEVLRGGRISTGGMEHMEQSAAAALNACSPDLRAVLCGNDMIFGCPMESRSVYEHCMINHSMIEGACSFAGGTQSWADAMVGCIRTNGGEVRTHARVTRIHLEGEKAEWVELEGGERIECGTIISDIHPVPTLALLENNTVLRKAYFSRMEALENSDGIFTLYLLMRPETVKYTGRNYHLHTADGRYAMVAMQPEVDTEYIKAISVMTRIPAGEFSAWKGSLRGHRGEEYEAKKAEIESSLLEMVKAFLPDIAAAVEKSFSTTPLSWNEYTGTPGGSAFGILKDWRRTMVTHIPARTKISNLLLTGQNLNLHGALGVAMSSVVTCSEILGTEYLTHKIGNA